MVKYVRDFSKYNGEQERLVLLGQDFLFELRVCFPQYSVCALCQQPVAGETGVSYQD